MKKAHFIGVCGKGMSATAVLLKELGWKISGSDSGFYPPVSEYLAAHDVPFATLYRKENIPADTDLIVIGKNAKLIPEENEEVRAAFASGKQIRSYPEVLEQLVKDKHSIVVVGTYAKSTCTALLAWCLKEAGKAPSYFIGEITNGFEAHAHSGSGPVFVLEGDEYPTANWDSTSKFLYYHPNDILLTSAAHDHVNVFPTHEDYLVPFKTLLSLIPPDGLLVANADEESARALARTHPGKKVLYGITHPEAEWSARDMIFEEESSSFTLVHRNEPVTTITTPLLGRHNVQNIVGISTLLLERTFVTPNELTAAIKTFKGVKRRLELLSSHSTVRVYEGFGSSYTKARAAIEAIQLHFSKRRIVVVFEPHQALWRSREMIHWYDDVFNGVDKILVYKPPTHWLTKDQLSLEDILDRIQSAGHNVVGFETPDKGFTLIKESLRSDDVVLILTSGGMDGMISKIAGIAKQKFPKQK